MSSSKSDSESSPRQPNSGQSTPDHPGGDLVKRTPLKDYDIICDGDLVLIVGQDRRRIRITIQAARTTSSVLSNLLDESNSTGTNNAGEAVELKLSLDDAMAALNAFASLYPGNPYVNDLTPEEIYDMVVFGRKYEMLEEFKRVAFQWFYATREEVNSGPVYQVCDLEDCWYLLMVARYMDMESEFGKLSERLIRAKVGYINERLQRRPPRYGDYDPDPEATIYWAIRRARQSFGLFQAQHTRCRWTGRTEFVWDYGSFYL
ncbi:hypothetical protein FBEOM_2147 [Fusarium beomiforme]|uniref:BTB domain-containing protein n=1 Tax=Fusarium beomiforme TaxID=44412 RepID=A0A9P5AU80_9HYPO|nr:hypothetical protein FBEOM_2147 [Fusarium beomiforme]